MTKPRPRPTWGGSTARNAWTETKRRHGTTCWLCGHPGATSTDHALPASTHPHLEHDPTNWRPAHLHPAGHPSGKGCPTPGCHCPGNTGRRDKPGPTAAPSRRW